MENYLLPLFENQKYDANNFFLIAGPCVTESEDLVMEVAERVKNICAKFEIPYIFKARYIDVLQIPAFLCRQTDLLLAAGETGKVVTVKKGQFLNGPSMKFAVDKIKSTGNNKVALIERGNSFGYTDLVVDYRNITWMKEQDVPVIMDCTHSLQQPNQSSGITGGSPQLIETIAKAAIATGADGLFIETHPRPAQAKSDGANTGIHHVFFYIQPKSYKQINNYGRTHGKTADVNKIFTYGCRSNAYPISNSGTHSKDLPFNKMFYFIHCYKNKF